MERIQINKNTVINIIIVGISFFATCFIPYIINFDETLSFSNSIISVIVFASFIYLLKKTWVEENKEKIKNTIFLGIVFSTFMVFGNSLKTNETIEYGNIKIYLAILFLAFIINSLLVQLFRIIEKIETRKSKESRINLSDNITQLIIFLTIIIGWIPVFLAAYPGYFCYDAYFEILYYISDQLSPWCTVIHNFILGFMITNLLYVFQNYNTAIAIYIFTQMIIVAGCLSYCIMFLKKYNTSKIIRVISVIYYALFPVVVMFAMCSTKDTIFSALALVSIIMSLEALLNKEEFLKSKWKQLKFAIVVFLAIIFRNNAIYAYIPFLIIFVIAFKNKKILISIATIIILYVIYIGPIYSLLNVKTIKNSEAFSVPLQQIARVYNYNYESLTDEELEIIYEYTTDEQLKKYLPECADPVKQSVYVNEIGYTKFLKLWAQIGIKNLRNIC